MHTSSGNNQNKPSKYIEGGGGVRGGESLPSGSGDNSPTPSPRSPLPCITAGP